MHVAQPHGGVLRDHGAAPLPCLTYRHYEPLPDFCRRSALLRVRLRPRAPWSRPSLYRGTHVVNDLSLRALALPSAFDVVVDEEVDRICLAVLREGVLRWTCTYQPVAVEIRSVVRLIWLCGHVPSSETGRRHGAGSPCR